MCACNPSIKTPCCGKDSCHDAAKTTKALCPWCLQKPRTAETLDFLYKRADEWPSHFNLAALGSFIVDHPDAIGKPESARLKASREHRERTRLR